MPPKHAKKAKPVAKPPAPSPAQAPSASGSAGSAISADDPNFEYLQDLSSAMNDILRIWPEIPSADPLPVMSTDTTQPTGFQAPFTAVEFDSIFAQTPVPAGAQYSTGINFFWMRNLGSITPWIPLYKQRVLELGNTMFPGGRPTPIIEQYQIAVEFSNGADLPKGSLARISPDELAHAPIFVVSERIRAGAGDAELAEWKRVLLSVPAVFASFPTEDSKYAAAMKRRSRLTGVGESVKHTLRQTIYNVVGFKRRKESFCGPINNAQLAKFYMDHVISGGGAGEELHKKSVIDSLITIHDRILSIPKCEAVIRGNEEVFGANGAFNNVWKLQEVIYRCKRSAKITWLLCVLDDRLRAGTLDNSDIKVSTLKSGGRSISDVALLQLEMRTYLRGAWLDSIDLPSFMKAKLRDIFHDHDSYRSLYAPHLGMPAPNTTWTASWPAVGMHAIKLFECTIYAASSTEEAHLRNRIREGRTSPVEVLAIQPWAGMVAEITLQLSRTAVTDPVTPSHGCDKTEIDDDSDEMAEDHESTDTFALAAARRLKERMVCLCVDPDSQGGISDLVSASPLSSVQGGPQGHVAIWCDCNVWGSSDTQPNTRKAPIPKDMWKMCTKVSFRHGVAIQSPKR